MIKKVQVSEKIDALEGRSWNPIELAKTNGQVIRLAYFFGDYHWHRHQEGDELFYVYRGKITVKLQNQEDVHLSAGELIVIPKNVDHCPTSEKGAFVLLFEPQELISEGTNK
ncbi:mannose-6-phosphate isomerase [Candidatus Heimdallarchaeota archaeon]|nr:MAG: mannose-6-phosphate isomerase [Candidatus Gerdarchaeota archaeon]RLI71184.1 MAG: mannose-6-phosphate isomerase [Candidatus Heimdallarchaeota archaeon]